MYVTTGVNDNTKRWLDFMGDYGRIKNPGKNLLGDDSLDALRYCADDILITKYFWGEFHNPNKITNVIFNKPATIIFWGDGTKTVVKCDEEDCYDPEKGLAMAISKRFLGDEGNYYNAFKKWLKD